MAVPEESSFPKDVIKCGDESSDHVLALVSTRSDGLPRVLCLVVSRELRRACDVRTARPVTGLRGDARRVALRYFHEALGECGISLRGRRLHVAARVDAAARPRPPRRAERGGRGPGRRPRAALHESTDGRAEGV